MKKLKIILIIMFALLIPLNTALAFTIPDRPENGFYDPDSYISIETKNKLVEFNEKHKATDHTQLGIAIVNNLESNNIEDISRKIATSWQIGYQNSNRGALLLISINDHKFRIETSNELRRVITDDEALEILNSTKSDMKNHNYDAAVQSIIGKIDNKTVKETTKPNNSEGIYDLLIKLLIATPFIAFAFLVLKIKINNIIVNEQLDAYKKECTKRSQFNYAGDDKLYPDDREFDKTAWTAKQIRDYKKEKQEEYSRRSDYNYNGHDKLRPGNDNFVKETWTTEQLYLYAAMMNSSNTSSHSSSSSYSSSSSSSSSSDSSSWSSSPWSGGGFDGGGASSGW